MNKLISNPNKLVHIFILERDNYLISTVAPASSNLALISLASASATASLTIEGAASTKSLSFF